TALLAGHDAATLADQLLAEGVPAGAALTLPEVMAHPQTAHREMILAKDDYKGPGIPIKLSRTPGGLETTPPAYGADSVAVLADAGFSPD
ncbi:CoA transferase, partial [Acinetobacter baumannii]